jgi:hypothetical protein
MRKQIETFKRRLQSNLAKVDSHIATDADYAEVPELSDDFFDSASEHVGGEPLEQANGRRSGKSTPP